MIGRLVEQQNVGLGRQHPRERRATSLAARKPRRVLVSAQAQFVEELSRPIGIVGRPQPGLDIGESGWKRGEIRLLRQIADAGARLDEARSAVARDMRPRRS